MKNVLKVTVGLIMCMLVGAAVVGGLTQTTAKAADEGAIVYLNKDLIIEAYAGPQIAAYLQEEDRLQAKFDEESSSLNDEERRELFNKYRDELQQYEIRIGLPVLFEKISDAIHESAEAFGATLVLDQEAVVLGGVDITEDVLQRLGLLEEENR